MNDSTAHNSVNDAIRTMVDERDWSRFHTRENLAKSIVIESAELLECFQWGPQADDGRVTAELADVVTYCHLLAAELGIDLDRAVLDKLEVTKAKYPVERSRGRSTKYDQL